MQHSNGLKAQTSDDAAELHTLRTSLRDAQAQNAALVQQAADDKLAYKALKAGLVREAEREKQDLHATIAAQLLQMRELQARLPRPRGSRARGVQTEAAEPAA
eukprot:SAG11_NODE_13337_length_659_cov_1.432143_2_plen_102_part_01